MAAFGLTEATEAERHPPLGPSGVRGLTALWELSGDGGSPGLLGGWGIGVSGGFLGTGLPPGHASLGLEKIPGLFRNPSGTGRSGIVELIQPVLNFQVAPGEDSVLVSQQVSVLGIEGGSALGELLVDLA